MRVPLSWLGEFVDVDLSPDQLAERLTLLGMEVSSIERWGEDWQQVVTGELLTVDRHPNADRLSLTTVTTGSGDPLSIVCGATNIAPGQRVPVALPGAVLPGDRLIQRAEKMGVVSNGMLCSGDELRLTSDADGILVLPPDTPLGVPLADLYGDVVLDVDVKPNRGDALSIVGLAREVAAATGQEVRLPDVTVGEGSGPSVTKRLAVEIRDPDLCSRFVGRWVSGVTIGPSPDRIQMRLLAAGQRPVSNVVDASNYVMLELGKPIHTFDGGKVHPDAAGLARIIVRRAIAGEPLETLDHVHRELSTDTLLIADPEGPLGLAGVMGGADSEISESTTEVAIESAIFDAVSIRRTAQRLGLRSEASSRFEKGQEPRLARIGADRTAELVRAWAGGEIAPGRVDTAPSEPVRNRVTFRPARVNRLLGTTLDAAQQQALLARVGIETEAAGAGTDVVVSQEPQPMVVTAAAGEALTALIPTWRRDLSIEADVAEEVARVHGYDQIESVRPDTEMPAYRPSPLAVRELVRETLAGAGLTEILTTALVSPRHIETFRLRRDVASVGDDPQPGGDAVVVTNPLSHDHSLLRVNLLGSVLDVVAGNLRHGTADVAVYEVGKGYARTGAATREWWRVGLALVGAAEDPAWNRPRRAYDLDDAKGLVELLARRLGMPAPTFTAEADEPVFHPGRTARASVAGRLDALLGEVHPAVVEAWDLRTQDRVILAELALDGLAVGTLAPELAPAVSRFPGVERDLAVVVSEETLAGTVVAAVTASAGMLLSEARLFDVYRGAPLSGDQKSLAIRLRFAAPDRTLTEAEVDEAILAVTAELGRLGGQLRA